MSLAPLMAEMVTKEQAQSEQDIQAANNRAAATPEGKTENALLPKFTLPSMDAITDNPIAAMGLDLATEVVGGVVQGLASDALKKLSGGLGGITGAMGSFFTMFALAMTAGTEMLMELARGNARLILTKLAEKDAIISKIQDDIIALNNAIEMLLGGPTFFDEYVAQLIKAYGLLDSSDKGFKSVVSTLKAVRFYNSNLYASSLKKAEDALELILPDRSADIEAIRSGRIEDTIAGANIKQAIAAAQLIPGITASITKNFLLYAKLTYEINGLVGLYLSALDEFILAYTRNDNIDKTTIDHITAGTNKLDELLGQMKVVLFPTPEQASSPLYTAKVMGAASLWGITLVPIIEWFRVEPGKASKQLDLTGESLRRYKLSLTMLKAQGDISVGLYTLKVHESEEDIIQTSKDLLLIITSANTVVGQQSLSKDVRQKIKQLQNLFSASKQLDSKIRTAITPFVNTPNNLLKGADGVLKDISNLSKSLGLDRASQLLSSCNIAELFTMTSETATFIGAAVLGVRAILAELDKNPDATDSDKQKMSDAADTFAVEQSTKKIEASRSSADTKDKAIADRKQRTALIKKQAETATKIGAKYEVAGIGTSAAEGYNAIKGELNNNVTNKSAFL